MQTFGLVYLGIEGTGYVYGQLAVEPTPGDYNGDGKPDLLGCVEWSVYPFYAHAALEMAEHPRYEIGDVRILD